MTIFIRVFIYSMLPLILASVHMLVDKQAHSWSRRVEVYLMFIFGVGIGASGIAGFFAHLFLSDLVAESIGWAAGSPFQLEIAFANLAIGVLGIISVGRRDGFRLATFLAAATFSLGATYVHFADILETGNLAPGNTIQNLSNILRPLSLLILLWAYSRVADPLDEATTAYARWHQQQAFLIGLVAAGLSTGYGLGFALGYPLIAALAGTALAITAGWLVNSRQVAESKYEVAA